MKIYGLVGNPLTHSFSQKYFTEKFHKENIKDCTYKNFEIKNPGEEILQLKKNGLLFGLNITIPYKSDIISFLDEISEECNQIGACNCIDIRKGKWTGHNTDAAGFEKSFLPSIRPHNKKALVLGTGGSSKAVAYVLKKNRIEFLFVSRNKSLPQTISYEDITPKILDQYTIVINTTPAGMYPNVEEYPKLPYEYINDKHYFFDLIYNPPKTLFLSQAENKGATIKNGDQMLAIQAEESWRIWTSNNL